ncbi:MAG: phosphate propanoyltransferase [Clostridiales Family XIII bacterium]|jgi:putative phosphotransacetylase|nr:phosphate propanoyltransferase [Clostridiales Family XIII bacterium]
MGYKVRVGISNKHLHLSEADLETLFGAGAELTPYKALVQPGQFAAEEKVDIVGPKSTFKGIRIIGPVRARTQVEIAMTDARALGVNPPVRESGKIEGSAGVTLIGPAGEITIDEGVIVALRHIHLSPALAADAGLKDQDLVDVQTYGTRPLIFQDVVIRSGEAHEREFHVDTDEANAAGVANDQEVEIIGKES